MNPDNSVAQSLYAEWGILQNQFDSYEKHSLYIKLLAIITTFAMLWAGASWLALAGVLIMWLQDAIWKTFQARIEVRLLEVECAIRETSDLVSCQFNSRFAESRGGVMSLVSDCVKQALRPTVAFPHVALLMLVLLSAILES